MSGDSTTSSGWDERVRQVTELGATVMQRLREGADGDQLADRWTPVIQSASVVVRRAIELGYQLWVVGSEVDAAEAVGELNRESIELLSSFPDVAHLYRDVDRFDAWLHEQLDRPGLGNAFQLYLEWVEGMLDSVIRRIVVQVTSDEPTQVSPERVESFLNQLDALIQEVLDRWLLDATLQPRRERQSRQEAASGTGGSDRDQ